MGGDGKLVTLFSLARTEDVSGAGFARLVAKAGFAAFEGGWNEDMEGWWKKERGKLEGGVKKVIREWLQGWENNMYEKKGGG